MTIDAPLQLHRETVRPEWIDYNGHMNVAYYVMVSDHATDAFFDYIGIGQDYVTKERKSAFAVDLRMVYLRELIEGSGVSVKTQLIDFDQKRFHFAHYLEHESEGWTAAISEWIGVHVDLEARRSAPFPPPVGEKLGQVLAAHRALPRPPELTKGLGLAKRTG